MKFKMQVGSAVYTVHVVPHLMRDKNCYGLTELMAKTIYVDEDLLKSQPDLFVQTFLHEVNHAALHEYGIRIEEREAEEAIVDFIALALTLLRRNKQFMQIMNGELK